MEHSIFLSIVIPTFNRQGQLEECLDGLTSGLPESHAGTFEVIVTDDAGDQRLKEAIESKYQDARCVAGPRRGPAANRNNGAKHARGAWLVFVDDDCLPSKQWLTAISTAARTGEFDVLEGRTLSPEDSDSPFKYYVENLQGGNYWSCNLAIRREAFFRLGGFDEDFLEAGGEDIEFAHRITTAGCTTHFLPDAVVYHPPRPVTMRSLWWRTFLIRWKLLYELKIGHALPLDTPIIVAVGHRFVSSIVDLLRGTWHVISRRYPERWSGQVFNLFWRWLTFPLVLPYMMIWDMRFRRLLRDKDIATTA